MTRPDEEYPAVRVPELAKPVRYCTCDEADKFFEEPNEECHFHGTSQHAKLWQLREQAKEQVRILTELIDRQSGERA